MLFHPYAGLPAHAGGLIEVLDQRGRPLLLVPRQSAQAMDLPHRSALVLLREGDGRLWPARSPARSPNDVQRWDFSARGPVLAGEAGTSAAARLLLEALGLPDMQPIRQAVLPSLAFEGARRCILFTAVLRRGQVPSQAQGMFVDKDELAGIAEHFPDLLSPCLLWCVQNGHV
jgi:isopentenyl-diphosphate delta-isomerase